MYYGEIVARISALLHGNPKQTPDLQSTIHKEEDETYTLHSLCAEAGRVFEMAEDLCEEYFIDWHIAVDEYATRIRDTLLKGESLGMIDLYILCARAIEEPYLKLCLVK